MLHVSRRQFKKYREYEKKVKISPKEMRAANDLTNFAGVSEACTRLILT